MCTFTKKGMPRIVYNVTVKVLDEILIDWVQWMQEKHIPDVMNTGCFESYQMNKILHDDGDGGHSYAIQYISQDKDKIDTYLTQFAKPLQKEHTDRYKDKYVAFRTLMEIVSSSKG